MPPRGRKAALAAVPEEAELASSPVGVEGIATPPLPPELVRDYNEIETECETFRHGLWMDCFGRSATACCTHCSPLCVAVEARIAEIQAAAEDSILALRNECRRQLVKLPKAVREGFPGGWDHLERTPRPAYLLLLGDVSCPFPLSQTNRHATGAFHDTSTIEGGAPR